MLQTYPLFEDQNQETDLLHSAFSLCKDSVGVSRLLCVSALGHALSCAALLTSCCRHRASAVECVLWCCFQEESIDVKALRARFNNQGSTSDNSSRDSSSPKSPRPGFGRVILPVTANERAQRQSPIIPPPAVSPGLVRFPRAEPMAASIPSRPVSYPRPPPTSAVRAPVQPPDASKVKQTGELLQNMIRRQQGPPGNKLIPILAPVPIQGPGASPTSTPQPLRQHPRQRSAGDVTPLRKPLPLEGFKPLKPKRPPFVNLEPFLRSKRGPALPALPALRKNEGRSQFLEKVIR